MRTTTIQRWAGGAAGAVALAMIVASCGSTGGGGGNTPPPAGGFVLNSNNAGTLTLNVSPNEVDANKSDRIGLVAQLSDRFGNPVSGVPIAFTSDIPDISFIPGDVSGSGTNFGVATTDANGIADIIAVAGADPTGTGDIVGTGAIFAEPPQAFGLLAQAPITLLDVGFIDAAQLGVIPSQVSVVEPAPGAVFFFNIVGGFPPYLLKNEASPLGAATLSQHCAPGCTENGGVLCVGSPCQSDSDCNANASPTPEGVCIGPIKRCLASCRGTNCGGSRCDTDADCNDGSPTPANVCKDSGQSIAYTFAADPGAVNAADNNVATHLFTVEDSQAGEVTVTVEAQFICGNGVAGGNEQCDLDDISSKVCSSFGLSEGCTSGEVLAAFCTSIGITSPTEANIDCSDCQLDLSCEGTGGGGGIGPTATPGPGGVTPTPTPGGGGGTPTPAGTPGPGIPSNLSLALLSNGGADNGNGTLTTVVAATVTDSNGNPVPNGTSVAFAIQGATAGAVISSPSSTNAAPPCDVSNFESQTGVTVLNQPGVAHTCITYPTGSVGSNITIAAASGAASDTQALMLPVAAP